MASPRTTKQTPITMANALLMSIEARTTRHYCVSAAGVRSRHPLERFVSSSFAEHSCQINDPTLERATSRISKRCTPSEQMLARSRGNTSTCLGQPTLCRPLQPTAIRLGRVLVGGLDSKPSSRRRREPARQLREQKVSWSLASAWRAKVAYVTASRLFPSPQAVNYQQPTS